MNSARRWPFFAVALFAALVVVLLQGGTLDDIEPQLLDSERATLAATTDENAPLELERASDAAASRDVAPAISIPLEPTPGVIVGSVRDERGAPIEHVRVRAVTATKVKGRASDELAAATTRDGRFELRAKEGKRFIVWTESSEHSTWRSTDTERPDVAAGEAPLDIRLVRRLHTRVFVADAATRVNLDAAGFAVLVPADTQLARRADVVAPAAEKLDLPFVSAQPERGFEFLLDDPPQFVVATAFGHAARLVQLERVDEQIVFLERSGGLRGELARAEGDTAIVTLQLRRLAAEDAREKRYVPLGVGRPDDVKRIELGADARFEFGDLDPAEYELRATWSRERHFQPAPLRAQTARVLAKRVRVDAGRWTDLGVLAPAAGGANVRVGVRTDGDGAHWIGLADVEARQHGVVLESSACADAAPNTFCLEQVPAGKLDVVFPTRTRVLGRQRTWTFDVGESGDHTFDVDLTDVHVCELVLSFAENHGTATFGDIAWLEVHGASGGMVSVRVPEAPAGETSFAPRAFATVHALAGEECWAVARDKQGRTLARSADVVPVQGQPCAVELSWK